MKRMFPKAILVTNVAMLDLKPLSFESAQELQFKLNGRNEDGTGSFDASKEYVFFGGMEQLRIALSDVNNEFYGVIFAIDEIHLYFNALDSKNIPMEVFAEISQQRKQRKLIIGTSQLFMRMAKPLREQCDNLIVCDTIFGILTRQVAYDGMTLEQDYDGSLVGNVRRSGFFIQTRAVRNAFDTFQKVISAQEQFEQIQRPLKLAGKKTITIQ